jgi:hypothetical protein
MITEYFYIFIVSIEFVGDEHVSPGLKVSCPYFGTWGFSACGIYVRPEVWPARTRTRSVRVPPEPDHWTVHSLATLKHNTTDGITSQ